jgi:hypothetical protein
MRRDRERCGERRKYDVTDTAKDLLDVMVLSLVPYCCRTKEKRDKVTIERERDRDTHTHTHRKRRQSTLRENYRGLGRNILLLNLGRDEEIASCGIKGGCSKKILFQNLKWTHGYCCKYLYVEFLQCCGYQSAFKCLVLHYT